MISDEDAEFLVEKIVRALVPVIYNIARTTQWSTVLSVNANDGETIWEPTLEEAVEGRFG